MSILDGVWDDAALLYFDEEPADDPTTICDKCGRTIAQSDTNPGIASWEGGTLCNDCFSEILIDLQGGL